MLRQLLTLLAVISGFTLAAEPVSAAQGAVVSVAAAGEQADCAPVVAAPLQYIQTSLAVDIEHIRPAARLAIFALAPSVQIQADRARE